MAAVALVVAVASCTPHAGQCANDDDCQQLTGGGVCVAETCVQCNGPEQCGASEFCCHGVCHSNGDVDLLCGCGASTESAAGEACSSADHPDGLCLVGATTASVVDVGQGVCGCGCTPDQGGPTCASPATQGDPARCTCSENDECRRASEDDHGVPHRSADTCDPEDQCVCFSLGTASACTPNGGAPDCASTGGCLDLSTDTHNCGRPGRDCDVDATGIAGSGTCVNGGCSCDAATDCQVAGSNVDTCAFPSTGPSSCVCAGYRAGLNLAPCPLELECGTGGCLLDGSAYATDTALLQQLGLRAPSP